MQNKLTRYQTRGGVVVTREQVELEFDQAIEKLIDRLDGERGALYASNFEFPGRYTRWDIGFVNPPLAITARAFSFEVEALNSRGEVLLPAISKALSGLTGVEINQTASQLIAGEIHKTSERFPEELRSKQPSIFSVLRAIVDLFYCADFQHLGLFGAFGYDMVFQFEALQKSLDRDDSQRDLVLYLPDEIYVVDHQKTQAMINRYEFDVDGNRTNGLQRSGKKQDFKPADTVAQSRDHQEGEFAKIVEIAKKSFVKGDLFEVVPGQSFFEPCKVAPSEIFRRLRERNPSPYGSFINLGNAEYLVGASPEMFVRVTDKRVETCPISGTIVRGQDAISDSTQILELLNSKKDESELTMCTDVDRNDKSRICEPGSVQVIGRRQIEMYSRLIHTVDHVEGVLRPEFDALDAFLSHMWVVTVTGAPKIWAMQFVEDHEKSARRWYAGAIGWLAFNGDMNTGLTIRTIQINDGVAQVRAGATLLFDSDPAAEEKETELKASAFLDAIKRPRTSQDTLSGFDGHNQPGAGKKILLVDHQDSFVHTLANYFRQTGAEVITQRCGFNSELLRETNPDWVVLSPGPGCPSDFNIKATIDMVLAANLPIFGVCLGLQGIVEYFGGELGVLDKPMHGKPSIVSLKGNGLFKDLDHEIRVGRYHSLYALKEKMPSELTITAESDDGVVMAIEHKSLPIKAVQFHPESILSLDKSVGLKMIFNLLA